MTCVVGMIKKNGDILMGADSAGSAGDSYVIRKDEKIFIKDDFIFGIAGSFRMGNILRYKFVVPKRPRKMKVIEYMNTTFIDALRECFTKNGFTKIENNTESIDGDVLIGHKGVLYVIYGDYQVAIHDDDFVAIGSGEGLASGSLYTTHLMKEKNYGTRIINALKSAAKYNSGVKPPFDILELEYNLKKTTKSS